MSVCEFMNQSRPLMKRVIEGRYTSIFREGYNHPKTYPISMVMSVFFIVDDEHYE